MNHGNIVIQTNLQVLDTPLINPQKLVKAVLDMGATALVYNVGGIYAWYPTQVPFHTVNPYLPNDMDLLKEVISECHRQQIQFIARFDFSKAEDKTYAQRPWWFVKTATGEPQIIGEKRPGNWSLLMSTCLNGEYRNQAVAIPILEEVLANYDIDGIFFNNPSFIPCFCETCQQKYREVFGVELPGQASEFNPEWAHLCVRDSIQKLYQTVKNIRSELPLILYYYNDEKLAYRMEVADRICAEPQDALSLGHLKMPEITKPILQIKKGRTVEEQRIPYGIVHSSPGMDWRHTGLPPAEYEYWLSLVCASGGNIWHSLTGFDLTITDQRIIDQVSRFNAKVKRVADVMDGARADAEVVLFWDASPSATGLANGLIQRQIPFNLILGEQLSLEALVRYRVLIMPENAINQANIKIFTAYVEQGGRLLVEGAGFDQDCAGLGELLGVAGRAYRSEELLATYLRFAGNAATDSDVKQLRAGFETTAMIALRGKVGYCRPSSSAKVLLTQVPPFAPIESVGAPPERASLLVEETDIPMLILNAVGQGKVLYAPFSLSGLIDQFRLADHYNLLYNMVGLLLDGTPQVAVKPIQGLYLNLFKKGQTRLIHLVNGVGTRPLIDNIPLHDLKIRIKDVDETEQYEVTRLITGEQMQYKLDGAIMEINLPRLDVWECLQITRQ